MHTNCIRHEGRLLALALGHAARSFGPAACRVLLFLMCRQQCAVSLPYCVNLLLMKPMMKCWQARDCVNVFHRIDYLVPNNNNIILYPCFT